jgi:Cu+-exporting ATPase
VTRANLTFAVLYNAGALTLCFLGLVTPVIAAILMPASSIAVVTATTWRLSGRRLEWMS